MEHYSIASQQALKILRDPSFFQWHIVPIFAFVILFYLNEIEKKNWNVVVAGLAYYGIEWIGEILNALLLPLSGYAPLWGAPGHTAYLILVGINIEITFMFAIFGIAIAKVLPKDPSLRVFGLPNRAVVIVGFSLFCVLVETCLNAWGALTWDYSWWGWPNIWSVVAFAYAPAIAFTIWVHDLKSMKRKIQILVALYCLDIALMVVLIKGFKLI